MKYIPPINTRRLSIELTELDMDDIQDLCEIPAVFDQRTASVLLSRIARSSDRPGAVTDPRLWSVNERMYVIGSYMAATRDDGPDFPLGEGHFSDYLLLNTDYPDQVEFEHEGNTLIYTPLLGYQAEIIETLIADGTYKKTAYSWWCGAIAACVRGVDEQPLVYVDDGSSEKVLIERIAGVRKLKDSQFVGLFDAYLLAAQRAAHFVYAITSEYGVLAAQVSDVSEGVPELAPARFPAHSAISERSREVMGFDQLDQSGAGAVLPAGSGGVRAPDHDEGAGPV
ncbi:hypothetical protein [Pseudomonas lurida]|uniref:hypothetical protein n=1 Tax=Pseudomonas lurida TaxID=244566 RepID=UPI00177E4B1C|nr:hypothetical protein [Pseudomonas lurida]MBD8671647.1 hypothetical protein [Pseudomonas lurida]